VTLPQPAIVLRFAATSSAVLGLERRFRGFVVSEALLFPRLCRFRGFVVSEALSFPRLCRCWGVHDGDGLLGLGAARVVICGDGGFVLCASFAALFLRYGSSAGRGWTGSSCGNVLFVCPVVGLLTGL